MDKILDKIYNLFMSKMEDLEMGHMLKDKDLCEMQELIHACELLDNNIISAKEQKQIIKYYEY